jgi:hypothetical protein
MATIYILMGYDDHEGGTLNGAYTTRELAGEAAASQGLWPVWQKHDWHEIYEVEVDVESLRHVDAKRTRT